MAAVDQQLTPLPANLKADKLREKWQQNQRRVLLNINGRLKFEITDETSFNMLLLLVERLENIAAIQEGLDDVAAGRTMSVELFEQKVRAKHGV